MLVCGTHATDQTQSLSGKQKKEQKSLLLADPIDRSHDTKEGSKGMFQVSKKLKLKQAAA
jgi:hypothetical protein